MIVDPANAPIPTERLSCATSIDPRPEKRIMAVVQ